MATATAPNTFVFNENQTVADILLVTATLERAGHRPQLRFVRWCDTPESIAVEFDPKEETKAIPFELTRIGRDAIDAPYGVDEDGPRHSQACDEGTLGACRVCSRTATGEMAVAGVDEAPDPAAADPIVQRRTALHDIRWSQVTVDTVVVWEGEQTTWGELAQNEKMMCEFYADGTLVGGFST